jgi:hypothetical protein
MYKSPINPKAEEDNSESRPAASRAAVLAADFLPALA